MGQQTKPRPTASLGLGSSSTLHPSLARWRAREVRKPCGHQPRQGTEGCHHHRDLTTPGCVLTWSCCSEQIPVHGRASEHQCICICQCFHDNTSHLPSPCVRAHAHAHTHTCTRCCRHTRGFMQGHRHLCTSGQHARVRAHSPMLPCMHVCSPFSLCPPRHSRAGPTGLWALLALASGCCCCPHWRLSTDKIKLQRQRQRLWDVAFVCFSVIKLDSPWMLFKCSLGLAPTQVTRERLVSDI